MVAQQIQRSRLAMSLLAMSLLAGCGPSGTAVAAGSSSGVATEGTAPTPSTSQISTSADSTTGTSPGDETTTLPESTSGTSTSGTSTSGTSTSGTPSTGSSSSGGSTATDSSDGVPTTGGPLPQPDGAACEFDAQCLSMACFVVGILGGTCGECTEDADCPAGGCTPPNLGQNNPAVCNVGALGDGCETSDVCSMGLQCGQIIAVPGIVEIWTCGECEVTADCTGLDSCQPDYDVVSFTGALGCVPDGSLADGHGCDLDSGGNAACDSGLCEPASLMGLATFGVCSECASDADCPGTTCVPPEVDELMGLVAGACQ